MAHRPDVVAFDVIETIFSLEPLRLRLEAAGLPGHLLETWFAQLLRDGFALSATGVYRPLREVAAAGLGRLFDEAARVDDDRIDRIISGFAKLDAHPDVAPAMELLHKAGVRIVALTNGSASVTDRLLERSGLHDRVERTISIDEVERWKPDREVYLHCARVTGVEPHRLALIAVHPWDTHGARRAGLMAGYVARDGKPYPSPMDPPHVTGATPVEVARKLLA